MTPLKIGIACDHAGRELKNKLIAFLSGLGYEVIDRSAGEANTAVDYPVFAQKIAEDLINQRIDRGILICGTGIGMSIAANKFHGIRAALVNDEFSARASKSHNNANIICLGARVINHDRAQDFVKLWIDTSFEAGRHQRRLDLISQFESE